LSRSFVKPSLAALLLACLAAIAPALTQESGAKPIPIPNTINDPNVSGSVAMITPDLGPLVVPGPAPDVIFVYTGRVVGFIEPCG
jgi:hypothetical protein